jgi:hypothetical protein
VFENRMLRTLFGPSKYEVIRGWRKLLNEELHNSYSLPSIIRMIEARRIRWTRHIARIRRRWMRIGYLWESLKEIDREEDHCEGWVDNIKMDGAVWTDLVWLTIGTS